MSKVVSEIAERISRFVIDNSNAGQNYKMATGRRLSDEVHKN